MMWKLLRNRKLNKWKFRRQHPISPGYILDFYCVQTKVAIELDGPYHQTPGQADDDASRSAILNELGIRVIRFTKEEVFSDSKGILQKIVEFMLRDDYNDKTPKGYNPLL